MRAAPRLIGLFVALGLSKLGAQSSPVDPAALAAVAAAAAGSAATAAIAPTPAVATTANAPQAGAPIITAPMPTITAAMPVIVPVAAPVSSTPRLEPGNLRITNLSTRARVTPENSLITGFAIKGDTSRTLLVRVA